MVREGEVLLRVLGLGFCCEVRGAGGAGGLALGRSSSTAKITARPEHSLVIIKRPRYFRSKPVFR
jgi:hypothetical protein